MSNPNKPTVLTDDEVLAKLSATELAIVDATITRANGQPITIDGSAYLHEHVQPLTVNSHADLARHIVGSKTKETRSLVVQNLSGQLLASMESEMSA